MKTKAGKAILKKVALSIISLTFRFALDFSNE